MNSFRMLIGLYMRDLVRRRLLWGLVLVCIVAFAINQWTSRSMEDAMGQGESMSVATRQAASRLDQLAATLRTWLYVIVVLMAAQVAPESRRNGTTQFLLSFGVRRDTLAAAQFCALGIVLFVGVSILHVGFAVAGIKTQSWSGYDLGLAWVGLLLPVLAAAACAFSVSLTASAIETYLLFLGIPFIGRSLPQLIRSVPKGTPIALVRAVENLALLFPSFEDLTRWPHLSIGRADVLPRPEWQWGITHAVFAVLFWVWVGVSLHRRHDFGSRTALK